MAIVLNGTSGLTTNSGTVISASTIGVGGTTPSASGAGISFPATQSASTDANTLDDYEEGTWTPTATNVTITSAVGTYTKIGRYVYLTFYGVWPATANGNAVLIQGLPFTSKTQSAGTGGGAISYNGSNTDFYLVVGTNTTDISTNTSNIATNTSNIGTNTSNITKNTSSISKLQ
jgi:hypothetical protein